MLPPPSRNARCPCGSGKRYKECHGSLPPPAADLAPAPDLVAGAQAALAGGRPADALGLLRRALEADPASAEIMRECARVEWLTGDAARAATSCRAALDRAPADVTALNLMGEILRATDPAAADAAWHRALDAAPDNAEAHFHLGNLHRERGDLDAALLHYERAQASTPDHAGLLNNLGLVLEARGDRDRAEECYRRVLAADARHPDALGNLANSMYEREQFRESAAAYERLFAIRRDVPAPVWVRRGMAHQRLGDFESAESCFREAARLLPDDIRIQHNLGTVRSELMRYEEAEPAWLRALDLHPDSPYALSMLAYGRQHRCAWQGLGELHDRLNRLLESDEGEAEDRVNPFALLTMPTTPRAQLRAAERWARAFAPASTLARPPADIAPGQRLRIGFVSSDLRTHPMVYLSLEYWEGIDRDRFETYAFGIKERHLGPLGQRIESAFDHFVDVADASVESIARRIHDERIAILIDLNGYTQNARERIFALRPAPMQVQYLGFQGTLGAPWYDYALVDRFGAPENLQRHFTEQLLYLPHSSFPSDTRRAPAGPLPSREECGLPRDAFVFCCFNNAFKILPDLFAIWMRLLHAVDGSVLWLLECGNAAEQNLRSAASASGVDPRRLIFAPRMAPVERHVARIAVADLVVDSYPYGAHTTANDALLAGVPVVTQAGETLVSRVAGSQLCAIGLPELVGPDRGAFETMARNVALDPVALAGFRARLAANRATHPLFDMKRFTRDFEQALLTGWRRIAGS